MSDYPSNIPGRPLEVQVSPRRYLPAATFVILAINLVIFLLMELAGGSTNEEVLLNFGASYGPYTRRGEYWRLVMPMFLHIGIPHLLVNSYALFVLGRILELVSGYGRFAFLYLGSGIGGAFLSMTLSPHIAAGASGAIFGIAGAMLVTGLLHREAVPPRWGRAFGAGIAPFIVLNLALGLSLRGIDNWGHLGGLVSGALLGALIPPPRREYIPGAIEARPSQAIVLIPLAVVVLAMAATVDRYRTSRVVVRLLEESRRLRAKGETDRARARIQEAVSLLPRDERPHEALGAFYLDENKVDEAIRSFEEARRLSPASPRAVVGLVLAYRRKGELAKARETLESAFGGKPDTAAGHLLLADLCAEQKFYADAVRHYREVLRLAPDNAAAHNNLAWLLATSEDPQFRDPPQALGHARRAVELSRWEVAAFVDTLAEAHYANGNFQEAVKVQTRALELEPDSPELREHMARYRKAAGQG